MLRCSSEQGVDPWTVSDDLSQFIGNTRLQTHSSRVEQGMHDRALQMLGGISFCRRVPTALVRLADNLSHMQAAAREDQRRQRAPMIAAPVRIQHRISSHLTGNDQQDPVG